MNHNEAMELMECALEALVSRCNASADACTWEEVIAAEAALERIYKSRKAIEQAEEQEHIINCPRCGHCCPGTAEQAQPVALSDEWTPCVKLPIMVHVRKQRMNEKHVSTREGITPVKSDDLIMRGVAGEEYPIGRDLFERTYTLDTTPPQRKPLTDEEIDELWDGHTVPVFGKTGINPIVFARAIEAAHGIKE